MKYINQILVILFFCFFSCNNSEKEIKSGEINSQNIDKPNQETKFGKIFFDYDQIDYYKIDITENDAMNLSDEVSKSNIDQIKENLILEDFPKNINEINFENKLNKIGFTKYKIKSEDFGEINKIFVEKSERDGIAYACIPIFRDVLIFKNKGKNIGFAKICFDCSQFHIVGTKANTENFGQENDYQNLGKILDKY